MVAIRCKVDGQHLADMTLQHKHTAARPAVPDAPCTQDMVTQERASTRLTNAHKA